MRYYLRWRFEREGHPPKYGMWSQPGNTPATQAWAQNKEGLTWAVIEGKNVETAEIKRLYEVPGQDFMNFQWIAEARLNPLEINGKTTPRTRIIGMKIVAREQTIEVYSNGNIRKGPNTVKNINFATFGK